jgi:putative polyketide hydroxylase
MSSKTQVPVLIIGGGIVGVSASHLVSHHGIKSMVVERHSGTSIRPRARGINAPTMELFHPLGTSDLVREAGASLSASKGIHSDLHSRKPLKRSREQKELVGFHLLDCLHR